MIEVSGLTMTYGGKVAVDDLSFTVRPGLVTGFLGPNGAGKSTTMRAVLGLERPGAGKALVNGRAYASWPRPLRTMGALLDAGAVHGGRSAHAHLACLARSNGIGRERVDAVLGQVGLAGVAGRRIGGFSLGMRQRLGIGAALLGDPAVLMLDEPLNGLDPEGIRWLRGLLRSLAAEGRTVLVSSHLMNEMALTADHVVVIGRGRLIADCAMDVLAGRFQAEVLVRTPHPERLAGVLRAHGATVVREDDGGLSVRDLDAARIGVLALSEGIALAELSPRGASLEEAFMRLTEDSAEHRAEYGAEYGAAPKGAVR
ncbi:ATP-binding cassette domain-containing protein [Nonomuraea rhodomycinica]|uniref:ATP-binding cassette domain-containing protein n=1 Tax=Nonomuraea rhodomycinica TaxID=1712872 RepID=A0A7Y6IKQ6_9ACTN|nr:ATP-binding cassette domain-containing protein [Nonomuraea rhodomycinica]NUW38679.1 ATP-binding cassette domain-containing protein [Nonomuraea rhodomycinica]